MEASTTTRTHLSALADLSRWAIEVSDLDALLKLAVAQIAETVGADCGLVLALDEGSDELTVRASAGVAGSSIDGARCGREPALSPRGSEPLVVPNFAASDAVAVPSLLESCSIASGVSLSLKGESSPFGVLAVYSSRREHFDAEDVTFLRSGANLLSSAIKRHAGERRLERTPEHSRLVVESLRNAIIVIDDDNRILSVNPAAVELFSYTAREFAGMHPRALLHPEDPDHVRERFGSGLRPDAPVSFTGRCLRKDGSTIHVSVNASRITWGGTPATLLEYSDITELAEATARLRASEEHLRHVFDTVQAALLITDNDGQVVLANRAAAEMLGYTEQELAQRHAADFVHPDEREALQERARTSTVTNPATPRFRRRMVRKGGESIWVEGSSTLLQIDGDIRGRVTEYRDISAQVETEAAAREHEQEIRERDERLRAIVEAAPLALIHIERDGRIVFFSGAGVIPDGDPVGLTIDERYAGQPERLARMDRVLAGESFSETIEYGGRSYLANFRSIRDAAGDPDGAVVVYIDDSERVASEQARARSEQMLAEAERVAHLGAWQWNFVTNELAWSDEIYRIFGLTPQEFGATYPAFLESVHPDDRAAVEEAVRLAVEEDEPFDITHRVLRPDGEIRVVNERGDITRDANGAPLMMLGSVHDITERVQVEDALREREAKLDQAQRIARLGWWEWYPATNAIVWSDEVYRLFGLEPGSVDAREAFERAVHPDDRQSLAAAAVQAFELEEAYSLDHRIVLPDGSVRVVHEVGEVIFDGDGKPVSMRGTLQDITEQAGAQRALRESEQRLRSVTETVDAGMVLVDRDQRVIFVNARLEELTGTPAEELVGYPLQLEGWFAPEDVEIVASRLRARLRGDRVHDDYIVPMHRPDGSSIDVAISANPVLDGSEIVGTVAMLRDVTVEVAAQESLRESEERLQEAQRIAELGSWGLDLKTYEGWWSDQEFRLFGLEPQSVPPTFELFMSYVHPDDRAGVQRALDDAIATGGEIDLTHRIVRADGAERVVQELAHIVFDESGKALRLTGTLLDITGRVAAERALQESEARYRSVLETISSGVLLIRDGLIVSVNQGFMDIVGYGERELIGMPVRDLVVPEDYARGAELYRAVIAGQEPPRQYRSRMIRSDGRVIEVESVTTPFAVADQPVAMLAEIRDVTEEVAAQKLLRESDERNRAIVDSIAVPLTVWSPRDELLHHNSAVRELTGYSAAELSAMRPQDLIDGGTAALILSDAADARAGVDPPTRICELIRADGGRRTVMLSMAVIDFPGEPNALLMQTVDISRELDIERRLTAEIVERAEERREFVQQLLRAQEEERRQIAHEIHDGPAQQLTGAAMFFETFRDGRTVRESDVAERRLELGVKYLNEALVETRRIMSRLRPALLDDLGLVPALRSSLSEMTSNAGIGFEFEITGEETRLDRSAEIVLFRVAQEAIANAVKHSGGTCVWLDLGFFSDRTELTVRDDGQGFNPATAPHVREEGRHLGLVGMRERTELLGGTFEIDSGAGRGTRLSVTIPRSVDRPADGLEPSHG